MTLSLVLAVVIKSGITVLTEPMVLTPDDSGKTFEGESGAIIAGGEYLTGWKDVGGGIWEAPAPKDATGKAVWFEQLWVNGRRATRSAWPRKGYLHFSRAEQTPFEKDGRTAYRETTAFEEDVSPLAGLSGRELADAQLAVCFRWSFSRRNLVAYDAAKKELVTHGFEKWTHWQPWHDKGCPAQVRFENVRFGFTEPGDWFYDGTAGVVRYRPLPGETIDGLKALAPTKNLSQLVVIRGDPDKGEYVRNVTFRNIGFFATSAKDADGRADGHSQTYGYQAARTSDAAIHLEGAHNITFETCSISHTGGYALRMVDGCMSNTIANCTMEDLGAGGVWAGRREANPDYSFPHELPAGKLDRFDDFLPSGKVFDYSPRSVAFITITNSTIRAGGRVNPEGVGVCLTHCSDSKVVHCDIHDLYYTGVSVGWTWGYYGSVAQRNEIAFNRIHDLGKGVMNDMGGVYTLGTSHGTTIHGNVIHDVWALDYGGWGLYNDEGSEGIVLYDNLVYDTMDSSYHMHYGRNNIVRNNIFAFSKTAQLAVTAPEKHLSVLFRNNIICWDDDVPVFHRQKYWGTRDNTAIMDFIGNLYWNGGRKVKFFWGRSFEQWQRLGNDLEGAVADPGFVNPAERDFRFRDASAVTRYGFVPFDFSKAGRISK